VIASPAWGVVLPKPLIDPVDQEAACAGGAVKGGGRTFNDSKNWYEYDWTCGEYKWSAEIGGIDGSGVADYDTPTTAGGNSWTMLCTGDGTSSNGTTAESTNCLTANETIRMYSMADIMLAHDQTRDGGKVYVSSTLLHHRYCGQSESPAPDPNGCPVLRHSPAHQQRKIVMNRGIMFHGTGADWDGPHAEGREGTYIILDVGSDTNGNGSVTDADVTLAPGVLDPGGVSGYDGHHQPLRVGWGSNELQGDVCARPLGSTGCVTSDSAMVQRGEEPIAVTGRVDTLIIDDFRMINTEAPQVCIDDRLTTVGVVDEDPRILCDVANPDATRPTSTSGGPVMAGLTGAAECISTYDAWKAISEALPDNDQAYLLIRVRTQKAFGTLPTHAATSFLMKAPIVDFTDAPCATNGRLIRLGGNENAGGDRFWPLHVPIYDLSEQTGEAIFTVSSKIDNTGGGFTGISVMPGVWEDRDSTTAAADCLTGLSGTNEEGCDDGELMALGGGIKGGVYDSAFWYGGSGGFSFSAIDGSTAGYWTELKRNSICRGKGLMSDASGAVFEDNLWCDNFSTGNPILALAFAPHARINRDRFVNNGTGSGLVFQNAPGAIIRDIEVSGSAVGEGFILIQGSRGVVIDGVTAHGVKGVPIKVFPQNERDVWDVTVSNTDWESTSINTTALDPHAFIVIADKSDGTTVNTATDTAEVSGSLRFINNNISFHGDYDMCGVFLEGGLGDESSVANGLNRTVDDYRHLIHIDGMSMQAISDGSPVGTYQALCLGNRNAGANDPGDTLLSWGSSVGGMPSWRNIFINSIKYPDNLYSSQLASSTDDCQNLPHGTIVRIHDDITAAGTCADVGADGILDGGGAFTSLCACDPAGDSGDGVWAPAH